MTTTTTTMQAAVVTEFGKALQIQTLPVPVPGRGEALVKVLTTGVCHTDLHAAEGDWPVKPTPPFIPGHEGVGEVVALGEGVADLAVGDLVGNAWLWSACGDCQYCRTGWETLCEAQQNAGYSVDGSFGEYMLVDTRFAARIPAGSDPVEVAPVLCAGVTVYKGLKMTEARPGQWVTISGIGGLGHIAVQYAVAMGLRVAAVDIADDKLALAKKHGAELTVRRHHATVETTRTVASGVDQTGEERTGSGPLLRREAQVEPVLAAQRTARSAQYLAGAAVGAFDPARHIGDHHHVAGDVEIQFRPVACLLQLARAQRHQRLHFLVEALQLLLEQRLARSGFLQCNHLFAQPDLRDDLACQRSQRLPLGVVELARHDVQHAQRTDVLAHADVERRAGIEAQTHGAGHQRVIVKARVAPGIVHRHHFGIENGVRAEGDVAGCLRRFDPDARLEPLPVLIHQTDDGHRRAADLRRQARQVVKRRFSRRVEQRCAVQRGQSLRFGGRQGCGNH